MIDLKTARPAVQKSDGSYEPAENIDMKTAEPIDSGLFATAGDMAMETIINMPVLGPFSPKQIEQTNIAVKSFGEVNEARDVAFKWFAMGMPDDLKGIEKAESVGWSDIMDESPLLSKLPEAVGTALDFAVKAQAPAPAQSQVKFPEGELKETLKQFPTEVAGDLLEFGTDPVSYLMAYGMQVGFQKGIPAGLRKLEQKAPQLFKVLTKQRGNLQKLAPYYDELGLKPTATETQIRKAYRKQAIQNHPDKGGNPDIMAKKAEAYNAIMDAREPLLKEIQRMYKSSRLGRMTSNQRGGIDVRPPDPNLPKVTPKERGFIASVKAEKPELLHKVAGQYIPRDTDELAIKARTLIEEDIATAERMAAEGTDDGSIAVGAELLKHYTDLAAKTTDKPMKDAMLDRATDLANTMAEKLTELGRSVQAAAILSRMTPEGQLKFAAKTIKRYNEDVAKQKGGLFGLKKPMPELTPEQTEHIITEMKAIQTMPEGEGKAIKFKALQDFIQDLIPASINDKMISVWKAGLLSAPTTHLKNISANIFFAGTEIASQPAMVAVDKMVSLISGKRTKVLSFKGYGKGVAEGVIKGARFLKTGYDERNVLSKYDYKKVNYGSSKVAKGIQKYTDTIFRLLGAEDQPFFYGARMMSLYAQAKVDGINKGLKGKALQANTDHMVMNPTEEMLLLATEDGKIAVFQNETVLGKAARQIQKVGGAEYLLPFGRTPSAVAMQIVNYTPLGAVKTILQNTGKGRFDQKSFSEGIGRAATGTVVMGFGSYLFLKGLMTLDYPTSAKEKALWEAEGRKPNSILIGGKWRSIESFGPAGNVLLVGGHFGKAYQDTGSVAGALMSSAAYFGAAKSFTEQTFLTGVKRGLAAVTDPDKSAESFINSLIASHIPNIVAKTAQVVDPVMRRTGGLVDRLKSRIPFLSLSLEPRVDVFGQEVQRGANFAELMLDPTAPKQMKGDKVVREIRRLTDANMDVKTTKLGGRKGYPGLTPEENTQLLKGVGEEAYIKIKELMDGKHYKDMPDDVKASRINEIFKEAKERARVDMAIQVTQGLQGAELNKKIIEFQKGKLLTREQYEEFLSRR